MQHRREKIDRRQFLARGVAVGAGVALVAPPAGALLTRERDDATTGKGGSTGPFSERQSGSRITLSCAGYSFRSLLPGRNQNPKMFLEDFIDFCAEQELDGVELTSYFFPRTDADFLHSLRRRAFLNGLTVTGTPVGNDFCYPAGQQRDEQLTLVRDWVDRAVALGAPCIRVFGGRVHKGDATADAIAWSVESMKEACAYAGTRGIVLALENHGGITSTADQLLGLVRAVDSPWLGVNLDTGNFRERDRDPYEEMEKAAPHAVVVQLKVEVTKDGTKQPTDIGKVLDILGRSRFRGVVALEYEAAEDPLTAVPRYLAELKKLLRG